MAIKPRGQKSEMLTSPSQLRTKAQELIASGQMPSLEEWLNAVAETRKEFRDKILNVRTTTLPLTRADRRLLRQMGISR